MFTVLAVIGMIVWIGLKVAEKATDDLVIAPRVFTGLFWGTLGAVVLSLLSSSIVVVQGGYRGVIFDRVRGIRPVVLAEGLNLITPYIQTVVQMEVRVQKDETTAESASKDLQDVHTRVAVNFHPVPEMIPVIYQTVGLGYLGKVVHPAVQEAVKSATARFTAEELITRREEVKNQIQSHLATTLATSNLRLIQTYITDFKFSAGFTQAIESKQVAEQQALKAKRDLDRIRVEAEQKIASARAEAESLKMQREAITPNLIRLRSIDAQRLAIEKWNGVLPVQMLGNAVPFLNVAPIPKKED